MEQLFRKEANKLDITNKPEKLDRFSMLMNTQTETIYPRQIGFLECANRPTDTQTKYTMEQFRQAKEWTDH